MQSLAVPRHALRLSAVARPSTRPFTASLLAASFYTTSSHPHPRSKLAAPCSILARPAHRIVSFAPVSDGKHSFSTTKPKRKDHYFDTLKLVERLKSDGFTEEQSQAVMRAVSAVVEETAQNVTRAMVSREDALKTSYTQKVDFAALRTELLNLDNSDSALTKATYERLDNELQKQSSRIVDEIKRTQASARLDLNLEKGRIREETNAQELKLKETETRIDQEVAGLRERIEAVKLSTLQWLMGVITGVIALMLGLANYQKITEMEKKV